MALEIIYAPQFADSLVDILTFFDERKFSVFTERGGHKRGFFGKNAFDSPLDKPALSCYNARVSTEET